MPKDLDRIPKLIAEVFASSTRIKSDGDFKSHTLRKIDLIIRKIREIPGDVHQSLEDSVERLQCWN